MECIQMSNNQIKLTLKQISHAENKHIKLIQDRIKLMEEYIESIRSSNWSKADKLEYALTLALTK